MKKALSMAVVLGVSGVCAGDVMTFNVPQGDWNLATNWTPQQVPGADDRAVIPSGKICNVDSDTTVDTIEIEDTATLNVEADVTLTLEDDDDNVSGQGLGPSMPGTPVPDHSIIDGTLNLGDSSNGGATLEFTTKSHRFDGDGLVFGFGDAEIDIAADIAFFNRLDKDGKGVAGRLSITGLTGGTENGKLINGGIVGGGAAGAIVLSASTVVEDLSGARWIADCKASITFNQEVLDLAGDFEHDMGPGEFIFNESVKTCGTYRRIKCGGITLSQNKTFEYVGFETDSLIPCPNPGSGNGTIDCDNPYTISSGVTTPTCE